MNQTTAELTRLELYDDQLLTASGIGSDIFAQWINYLDVKDKTAQTYTRAIRQFAYFLEDQAISRPTREDVLLYRETLRASRKPATIQAYMTAVKLFFSWTDLNGIYPNISQKIKGGAEQKIRKYLIDNNYVDCVIQLPSNLFFGTSIATCIMVLKKSKPANSTLFIDASQEFVKITNSNKLTDDHIAKIVDTYAAQKDSEYFARLVNNEEIAEKDYNLSVSTYVEQEDTREIIDIQKLNAEIEEIVAREETLREEIRAIIAEIEVE